MIRLEFRAIIDQIHRDRANGVTLQGRLDVLLAGLLKTRAVWPRQAIVDMVYGGHGEDIARMTTRRLIEGLYPVEAGKLQKHLDALPFAWLCLAGGHGDVLKAIAKRGIPVEHLTRNSTTQEWALGFLNDALPPGHTRPGQALDLMANSMDILPLCTFPGLALAETDMSPPSFQTDAGVKLLFEVDPTHPDIALWQGTSLAAQLTQLQMLKQIDASTGQAALPVPPSATRSPRRAL